MKSNLKIAATAIVLSVAVISFNSCSKSSGGTISDATAASLVSSAASSTAGGLGSDVTKSIKLTDSLGYKTGGADNLESLTCNVSYPTSINWSDSLTSGTYTYSYSFTGTRNYELLCNGGAASSFVDSNNYHGHFVFGSTMNGSTTSGSNWTVTQLGSAYTSYVLNGEYNQTGTYNYTYNGNTNVISFTMNFSWTNLTVDKSTRKITSGTGTLNMNGGYNGGNSYSAHATISVSGGTGTYSLNGTSYTVNF